MLIEKKPVVAVNDTISLRLINGEEVIGKLVELGAHGEVTLSKPVVAQMQMVGPGQAALAFGPFMMSTDETVKITFGADRLLAQPMKTRSDIAAQYIKMTTGLDVPATGGLLKV